jgi:hypothetical protein
MRVVALIACMLVGALASGQGFNKRYDAFNWGFVQGGFGVLPRSDGFVTFSLSEDFDSISPGIVQFHASILITKIDFVGQKLWEKRSWRPLRSTFPGWVNCCDMLPDGGFVAGGSVEDSTGFDEACIIRFNAMGDTIWSKVYGDPTGNKFWIGYQTRLAENGDFIMVGITDQNGPINGFVLRTDNNGNELYRNIYAYSPSSEGGIGSVVVALNGHLYTAGTRSVAPGNSDRWIQKLNPNGGVIWQQSWGGPWHEGTTNTAVITNGRLLACGGAAYGPNYTSMRPYVALLDTSDGQIIWEREFGGLFHSTQFMVCKVHLNGDIVAAGRAYDGPGPTIDRGLLARLNSNGDSLWMYRYFYQDSIILTGQGQFYDLLPLSDGYTIATGTTRNPAGQPYPPGYSQDTWVVKVDADGCIIPGCNSVGIEEQATNLVGAISIYPNPAQGQCTVKLSLPPSVGNGPFELSLVASDGRVMRRERIAGNGAHTLALEQLPAGLYYVHVADGGKWLTGGKLVLQ